MCLLSINGRKTSDKVSCGGRKPLVSVHEVLGREKETLHLGLVRQRFNEGRSAREELAGEVEDEGGGCGGFRDAGNEARQLLEGPGDVVERGRELEVGGDGCTEGIEHCAGEALRVDRDTAGNGVAAEELVWVTEGSQSDDLGLNFGREEGEPLVCNECALTMRKRSERI